MHIWSGCRLYCAPSILTSHCPSAKYRIVCALFRYGLFHQRHDSYASRSASVTCSRQIKRSLYRIILEGIRSPPEFYRHNFDMSFTSLINIYYSFTFPFCQERRFIRFHEIKHLSNCAKSYIIFLSPVDDRAALAGETAVPCYLQSATAGVNAQHEGIQCGVSRL